MDGGPFIGIYSDLPAACCNHLPDIPRRFVVAGLAQWLCVRISFMSENTHMYIHIYIYIVIRAVAVYVRLYVCMYVCMYVFIYMYIYIYIYIYICARDRERGIARREERGREREREREIERERERNRQMLIVPVRRFTGFFHMQMGDQLRGFASVICIATRQAGSPASHLHMNTIRCSNAVGNISLRL